MGGIGGGGYGSACVYLVFCFKSFGSIVVHVLYMRPEAGQTNRIQPVQHCSVYVCVCVCGVCVCVCVCVVCVCVCVWGGGVDNVLN